MWETLICVIASYTSMISSFSLSTFEENFEQLQAVFERLHEHYLKLKPSKCELFKECVSYPGHKVSEKGINTDPTKIEAVKSWPVLKNINDVHRFLGVTGYYLNFITGFATIPRPLNDLLIGTATNPKPRKSQQRNECHFNGVQSSEIVLML